MGEALRSAKSHGREGRPPDRPLDRHPRCSRYSAPASLEIVQSKELRLMIEVEHLVKSYRELKAVNDVSFQVQSGEILGFLGPNGAGKTTTMRILTGVLPPTSGKAKVSGFDVFENPIEAKKRIGYLQAYPPVYTDMTARAYLRFVASIKGVPRKSRE